jgi:hypothetical protein
VQKKNSVQQSPTPTLTLFTPIFPPPAPSPVGVGGSPYSTVGAVAPSRHRLDSPPELSSAALLLPRSSRGEEALEQTRLGMASSATSGRAPARPELVAGGRAPARPKLVGQGRAPARPKLVSRGRARRLLHAQGAAPGARFACRSAAMTKARLGMASTTAPGARFARLETNSSPRELVPPCRLSLPCIDRAWSSLRFATSPRKVTTQG